MTDELPNDVKLKKISKSQISKLLLLSQQATPKDLI